MDEDEPYGALSSCLLEYKIDLLLGVASLIPCNMMSILILVRHIIITFQMARLDSLCLYYAFFVTDWCENQTSNARDGDQCRCMILLFKMLHIMLLK